MEYNEIKRSQDRMMLFGKMKTVEKQDGPWKAKGWSWSLEGKNLHDPYKQAVVDVVERFEGQVT